jgi:signal transduction histidine kinase
VGEAQSQVNEDSLPEVVAAFGIAQHSGTLVNAAPRLTAATTPEELAAVSAGIDEASNALEQHLSVLLGGGGNNSLLSDASETDDEYQTDLSQLPEGEFERSERIRTHVATLEVGIDAIENGMIEIFELNDEKEDVRAKLTALQNQIDDIMIPTVDNQLFYTMTGYRNIEEPPVGRHEHFSEVELARYRNLAGLHADATTANQILESAFSISSAPLIEPLRERFESAVGSMERNLSALDDWSARPQILPLTSRLTELGTGEDNGFDILERQLQIIQHQQDLLTLNRGVALALVEEIDSLVSSARSSADVATQASAQAILTGRTLLLAISALSVVGALLIAWLFVGRMLLRRIQMLSDWMLRMAAGDLESKVEMEGRDEVADMARALEIFRRNSLEAQRLNLVEQLAEELQGKNEELERVLGDLERAQDQIVMREKLAALGELTAGVAHEIRNPLNFVKNFSEASEELLGELDEILVEVGDNIGDEDKDYIQEISGDLTSNLERIRTHGDRANRIVNDMLMMGRDTGEQRLTDINGLLDEHARLAYHSARGLDSNFQLDLQHDLDPNMGEINVVPRDLGRVFLNIVGNACDATDERRRELQAEPQDGEPYMPTLWISTRKGDENVEIRIKDNGGGMPPDVIDKIFNPFFTTKPTDKGTGLGLAISNDIVRQHGGTISVDSKQGEYTEMTIELPLDAPLIEADTKNEVNIPYR